jgi:hypothetical protein
MRHLMLEGSRRRKSNIYFQKSKMIIQTIRGFMIAGVCNPPELPRELVMELQFLPPQKISRHSFDSPLSPKIYRHRAFLELARA